MEFCTEGVLILGSARKLAEEYKDKEFDYDFPNGLSELLNKNIIIAVTTSDGDNIVLNVNEIGKKLDGNFNQTVIQCLNISKDDNVLILSHAEFTQICSKGGDFKNYGWPIKKIETIDEGLYKITIGIEDFRDNFDEIEAYYRFTISLERSDSGKPNTIVDVL
jgi:hypothetical protein